MHTYGHNNTCVLSMTPVQVETSSCFQTCKFITCRNHICLTLGCAYVASNGCSQLLCLQMAIRKYSVYLELDDESAQTWWLVKQAQLLKKGPSRGIQNSEPSQLAGFIQYKIRSVRKQPDTRWQWFWSFCVLVRTSPGTEYSHAKRLYSFSRRVIFVFFELSTYRGGLYFDNFLQLRSQGNLSRPFFSLAKNSKKSTTAVNMFLFVLTTMHLLKSITPGLVIAIFRKILFLKILRKSFPFFPHDSLQKWA